MFLVVVKLFGVVEIDVKDDQTQNLTNFCHKIEPWYTVVDIKIDPIAN
jgi:hypothetical protein